MASAKKKIIYLDHFIEIVPLEQLPQTEEIVNEEKLDALVATLKKGGLFPSPITAVRDPESQKILPLDGNHRRMGGERIGLTYLPVIFVAWEEFKIEVWNRAVEINHAESLKLLFQKSGLIENRSSTGADQALFYFNGESYSFENPPSSKIEAHKQVHRFLNDLAATGVFIGNSAKSDARVEDLKNESGVLVIELPRFSKSDLISFLHEGVVLPPKAYRTILPYGPIRLPVKLEWLSGLQNLSENQLIKINQEIQEEVRSISFIELPNTVDVSESKHQFFAPLRLAPVTLKEEFDFNIINYKRLKKLRPLILKNIFSRGLTVGANTRGRIKTLAERLKIQLDLNMDHQQNERGVLSLSGEATMDMEAVFELCKSDQDLEEGIEEILNQQSVILDSIKLSKQLIYLSNDNAHAHNIKYPHSPS
ncbi:MAG: ParB N-terminal domain-containing protein [Proteobacteria bacterium]|nr:ParB N-terminal domain-containing protein [Pseudomonadota bacterium]